MPVTLQRQVVTDLSTITEPEWNALDHHDNPFLSLAFLTALQSSGSVDTSTGWQAHHLSLYEGNKLVGFAPTYLKSHSHGEFVFDWAWADAYQRHGRFYYPKLLTAVPYSPIPGPRLMVRQDHPHKQSIGKALVQFAIHECDRLDLSSWHCNFVQNDEQDFFDNGKLLPRSDWQFHWFNQDFESFDQFLGALRSKKRKNIKRERRQVTEAGLHFEQKTGSQLEARELDFIFDCYQQTFFEHGNHPALNRAFFDLLQEKIPEKLLAILAKRGEEFIAMSLYLMGGDRLYGRYWGCMESVPGLHFETAYYQGIEYCIANGLKVFEPGAQGEHKISRGFTPVPTHSFHLVRDPLFNSAISQHLKQEKSWQQRYGKQLLAHLPFRK